MSPTVKLSLDFLSGVTTNMLCLVFLKKKEKRTGRALALKKNKVQNDQSVTPSKDREGGKKSVLVE